MTRTDTLPERQFCDTEGGVEFCRVSPDGFPRAAGEAICCHFGEYLPKGKRQCSNPARWLLFGAVYCDTHRYQIPGAVLVLAVRDLPKHYDRPQSKHEARYRALRDLLLREGIHPPFPPHIPRPVGQRIRQELGLDMPTYYRALLQVRILESRGVW